MLFIHQPRTAGTAVGDYLGLPRYHCEDASSRHWPAWKVRLECPKLWEEGDWFSIVRNPFDWIVSLWTSKHGRGDGVPWEEYVFSPKLERFLSVVQSNNVDGCRLLRFESIAEDLSSYLGRPVSLPVSNDSVRGDYREYYNDESRLSVERLVTYDLSALGYEF